MDTSSSPLFDLEYLLEQQHRTLFDLQIQLLKDNRRVTFFGASTAVLCVLFSMYSYAARHPEDDQFKLLLTLNAVMTIALFCYVIKDFNKKIEDLETCKMKTPRLIAEDSALNYDNKIEARQALSLNNLKNAC